MRIVRPIITIALLSIAASAAADEWLPYTDGRVGGCYEDARGELHSCTPQPEAAVFPSDEPDPPAAELAAQEQLREVRLELEALKLRQAADDARRAQEDAARLDAERDAKAAEQRDRAAAMQAYNEIEAAMDGERRKALELKTEACRGTIEAKGYRIMAPGACRAPDGTYTNCPEC
jgi:hypothetical protein